MLSHVTRVVAPKSTTSMHLARHFGLFSSEPVNPPGLLIVGAEAVLGYDAPKRAAFLAASVPVLKYVSDEAIASAISLVDEHADAGVLALPVDYSLAVNAAIIEFAKDETKLLDSQIKDILAIGSEVHSDAITEAMEINTPVLDVLDAVSRGAEECKVVLAADAGPIFSVRGFLPWTSLRTSVF